MKGQVSTEYLVILAVVLVVALVVVFLVGGFAGLGAGSIETQSKSYWAGTGPFSIDTYKVEGTDVTLVLINNDLNELILTDVTFDGTSLSLSNTTFASGEQKTVTSSGAISSCGSSGAGFEYDLVFTYTKSGVAGLTQTGQKPLVGKCA